MGGNRIGDFSTPLIDFRSSTSTVDIIFKLQSKTKTLMCTAYCSDRMGKIEIVAHVLSNRNSLNSPLVQPKDKDNSHRNPNRYCQSPVPASDVYQKSDMSSLHTITVSLIKYRYNSTLPRTNQAGTYLLG